MSDVSESESFQQQEKHIFAAKDSYHFPGVLYTRSSQQILSRGSNFTDTYSQDNTTAETKILASFLPDEIIYNIDYHEPRTLHTALLFGDLSGFTDLCEKYSVQKGGFSRLTEVLNKYIGAIVQEIMSHGGDILKFSGDAFVVIWKKSKATTIRDAVHMAIDCGLIIQKNYGSYQTDVDVTIRMKLIVTAGELTLSIIGDQNNYHYLETGRPIWDLKVAEHFCRAGNVIVTPFAWQFIAGSEYSYEKCEDREHIKVNGIGNNWRMVNKKISTFYESASSLNENKYMIRPVINFAISFELKDNMRKFILKPVLNALNLFEPLDYLTEVRHVTVLMFNLIIEPNLLPKDFLAVANISYKIVCSVVSSFNGIVNKINFFDKDLMVLVIFGLRGFKMDFESEISLNCAVECKEKIMSVQKIQKVSIGVCSGITYCGVFGHALRKEYTVISLVVNKAARLMMAYPNKVTCDRNVFISSVLEAKHFILQDYIPLKGIKNPGPIYEYKPLKPTHNVAEVVNIFPILGRDEELELYKSMVFDANMNFSRFSLHLDINASEPLKSMLMLEGHRQYGTERLMEEFSFVTPRSIPQARIKLIAEDKSMPFQAIRMLFLQVLGLSENSPTELIQKKISRILKDVDNLHYLNKIFLTNFEGDEDLVHMTGPKQRAYRQKLMKFLVYKSVTTFWVFSIHEVHFIDYDSWILLAHLLTTGLFFVICSRRCDLPFFDQWLTANMHCIKMTPLHDTHQCALACQIMNVDAISPELERIIRSQSEGKPSQIKNLLITMIQASEVIIKMITYKEAYNLGFSIPPEYLTRRLRDQSRETLINILKAQTLSDEYLEWNIFKYCYREDFKDLTIEEKVQKRYLYEKIISVAKINHNITPQPITIEASIDAWMIRIFDSLTPFQKLLLKASSVLSGNFRRDMLMFILTTEDDRNTAIAIKTLFEKQVLCCAHGDFLDGNNTLLFSGRLIDPSTVTDIRCYCRGLAINDVVLNLPKYASCGYLCFHHVQFKNIVYNLLTEKQKQDFHSRAAKYLVQETRKCKACGNLFMSGVMETKPKMDWKKVKKDKKTAKHGTVTDSLTNDQVRDLENISFSYNSNFTQYTFKDRYSTSEGKSKTSKFNNFLNSKFGPYIIYQSRKFGSVMDIHTTMDFSQCKCYLILISVYAELIDHYKEIGETAIENLFIALIAYAKLNIDYAHPLTAQKVLYQAATLLNQPAMKEKYLYWMLDLKRGKIYTLMAHAFECLGQRKTADAMFQKALRCFGCTLPEGNFKIKLNMCWQTLTIHSRYFVYFKSKQKTGLFADFHNDLSFCLLLYSKILVNMDCLNQAELAVNWCLKHALAASNNFILLCKVYAQIILLNAKLGKTFLASTNELYARRMCYLKITINDFEEAEALRILYRSFFIRRLYCSKLNSALDYGSITWHIGTPVSVNIGLVRFYSLLMINSLYRKMITDAVTILQEVEFHVNEDVDVKGKLNLYYLCLVLQLETGYTVESYKSCEEYLHTEGYLMDEKDSSICERLHVVMWLWCNRQENWELARFWKPKAYNLILSEKNEQVGTMICGLYLLEAEILYLVRKIDKRNTLMIHVLFKRIDKLIKTLDKFSRVSPIIKPRLAHLKAYYKLVKFNDYSCLTDLKTAKKLALKYENLLEYDWICHSEKAWNNKLPRELVDFWKEHAEYNLLDTEMTDIDDFIGFFTLPVPVYLC